MATRLRPHGWTHILHDYGWQLCGTTYNVQPVAGPTTNESTPYPGCLFIDGFGRLLPSPERYPSTLTATQPHNATWGRLVDRVHTLGIAFGLHLVHGVPKLAVERSTPILGTRFHAGDIVEKPLCQSGIPDMWSIDASHPAAAAYYDSVVLLWEQQGVDFIYLDFVLQDCGRCRLGEIALIADSLKRLGNGMQLFLSYGPAQETDWATLGCPFEAVSAFAPYSL